MKKNRPVSVFDAREEFHRAELNTAAAKMKVHEIERLAFTDQATPVVKTGPQSKNGRSALLEAFSFLLSRL